MLSGIKGVEQRLDCRPARGEEGSGEVPMRITKPFVKARPVRRLDLLTRFKCWALGHDWEYFGATVTFLRKDTQNSEANVYMCQRCKLLEERRIQ
jgi:hypothetical protein